MKHRVDQRGATADGDIVAGDKSTTIYSGAVGGLAHVERLLKKLQDEIDQNTEIRETVENLVQFYSTRDNDGIIGLEAKLSKAGRNHELHLALEKKEAFAKFLEKWSMYASAQEIIAYLLGKIDHEFNYSILPKINSLDESEVNQLVTDRIVTPTITECGVGTLKLSHTVVMGMVYWLAERCFVRWHR